MKNKLNLLVSSFVITLTLALPKLSHGSEEKLEDEGALTTFHQFSELSPFVDEMILTEAVSEVVSSGESYVRFALVSKQWSEIIQKVMQEGEPIWDAWPGVKSKYDEEIYQAFLNSKLVYRPVPHSDEGKIEFKISDFQNPFKGTFDLSKCGSIYQHLNFTTDPVTFFEIEKNNPKLNILIAPHFLITKLISTTAKEFADINVNWNKYNAPVAIFWTWSSEEYLQEFDYLTHCSMMQIASKNLFAHDPGAAWRLWGWRLSPMPVCALQDHFMFVCEPK